MNIIKLIRQIWLCLLLTRCKSTVVYNLQFHICLFLLRVCFSSFSWGVVKVLTRIFIIMSVLLYHIVLLVHITHYICTMKYIYVLKMSQICTKNMYVLYINLNTQYPVIIKKLIKKKKQPKHKKEEACGKAHLPSNQPKFHMWY